MHIRAYIHVHIYLYTCLYVGFLGSSAGKESSCNGGHPGLIPELGRSPREGNDYPLQYSCLENPYGQRSFMSYNP